jgi:hypothetical protein
LRIYELRREALANAEIVLAALASPDQLTSAEQLESMKGRRITFQGVTQPPGSSANLITVGGIIVDVEIVPPTDPRPMATMWTVSVTGVVKSVDLGKRTVFIRAAKEDWQVLQTW